MGSGPPEDKSAAMALMGLPLIGAYQIILEPAPTDCSYEGASYIFYVVYAKKVRH